MTEDDLARTVIAANITACLIFVVWWISNRMK